MITQLFTGLIPIYLLYKIQLPEANRRVALMSFTPSLSYVPFFFSSAFKLIPTRTIPLSIIRLIYFQKARHSSSTTASSFNLVLVTTVQTNTCVIASCLTFLKPLVDSLAIGLVKNDIRVPLGPGETNVGGGRINPFSILSGRKTSKAQRLHHGTWYPTSGGKTTSDATAAKSGEFELEDLEQHGSQDRMVIKQTKTTEVSSYPKTSSKDPHASSVNSSNC